jgi:hypothetical protein
VIEVPRALARQFRALLRRCSPRRGPHGTVPLVLVRAGPPGLCIQASLNEAALRFHQGGPRPADELAFRIEVLARCEGRDHSPVCLERLTETRGRASWQERGEPHVEEFEVLLPDAVPAFSSLPARLHPQPLSLLVALVEAARTAARDSGRFAVSRIMLAGKSGEVVGTDGKHLLIQGGFELPCKEDLLVPALPVFAAPELSAGDKLSMGRTETHVALVNGPWTVLLAIDAKSRYPDYRAVVPRSSPTATVLEIAPGDDDFLVQTLPRLPAQNEDVMPVTLELGEKVLIRASQDGQVTEALLSRSRASGPVVRVATDRRYLLRALQLGFRRVQAIAADKPLLCRDEKRTYVWMPLSQDGALPPSPDALRLASAAPGPDATAVTPSPPRRRTPMPAPNPPPRPDRNGAPSPEAPGPTEAPGLEELIGEVEMMRSAAGEMQARLGRLVAALKQMRRRNRTVEAALASLRQLPLSP